MNATLNEEVLKGLNLSVPKHSIYGFIGKNGAGKTTVLILLWSAYFWLCFGITYGYNAYFWDNDVAQNLVFAVTCW